MPPCTKVSGNRSSGVKNKSPVASTPHVYEGGKLFFLSTDHELSRGESNPKLLELLLIKGRYILIHSPQIARNSKFYRVPHQQVTILRKHRT